MSIHIRKLVVLCSLLAASMALASCGGAGVGTIPSGTPDHGNGTPAVIPTPQSSPQPVVTAPASALGAAYAFVRENQLWVTRNGGKPAQVTHFDYSGVPDVFWHQPVWSPGDHFIAFIMNARPAGQGGGGCPAPDYGANGALYLLNTSTMQLTQLGVAADSGDALAKSAHNGYWQYVFWEDSTHLLAWYNGVIGKTGNTAGLYSYDVGSGMLTQVMPLSGLGVATLFNAQKNMPLLLSMRYSSGQLFYQVVVHPFEQQSQIIIYSHPLAQPRVAASKVLTVGNEPWCAPQQSGPFVKPGWDVSVDGEQLAAQMFTATGPGQAVGSIQVLNLKDGSTTGLFAQASANALARDLTLAWGPDSQTLVVAEDRLPGLDGPYSATLANPAAMQQYTPNMAGEVTWRSDGSAFALQNPDAESVPDTAGPYLFTTGSGQGQLALIDVQIFVWGN